MRNTADRGVVHHAGVHKRVEAGDVDGVTGWGQERLEFERAAVIRDKIEEMHKHISKSAKMLDFGKKGNKRRRK